MEKIICKPFNDLNTKELYELLALRIQIFVVEQNCVYPELDYHDQHSYHLLLYVENKLRAYARIVAPNTLYSLPSIGRVAVDQNWRRQGLGRKVFKRALDEAQKLYPGQRVRIQAQTYLIPFYESLGFLVRSEEYPDYGIMHVDMETPDNNYSS